MLASPEQRQLAGRIGVLSRWHPDHPDLPVMREQLTQLRIRTIYAWALVAMRELPAPAEVDRVATETRKLGVHLTR